MQNRVREFFHPKNEADRRRLMKYGVVFPALILSFLVAMWLIFGDGFSSDNTISSKVNMELPAPDNAEIADSKLKALEEQALQDEKSRQDSIVLSLAEQDSLNLASAAGEAVSPIESSAQAYNEVQASLDDFFIPENNEASQVSELQARIDELEMQNAIAQQQTQQPDEMALLERSYQLAAQYMGGNGNNAVVPKESAEEEKGKRDVRPVRQVKRNVVSSLAGNSSERVFNTSVGVARESGKNTVAAVVASDQKIEDDQMVRFRTVEPMQVGQRMIPRNTAVTGLAHLQGERLEIEISSITVSGSVYEVDLAVYDSDGQPGINVPGCMESDALHEIGANMGSSMGGSINLTTDAGAQFASDAGKGLLNGISQYLTKKLRTVKVHLKAGYKVMLHQPED